LTELLMATEEGGLIQQELGFVVLLFVAAMVAVVVRRIRLPYTVALVLVGLFLSFFPNFLNFTVSEDLILAILVPPLIFEATLHIPWKSLRKDLGVILLLAIGGTLVGTFLVGSLVVQFLGLPWVAALAFGALISATDPVAVIAFFRNMGVSKRLTILVEGESLFNDGVAIVIFNLAVAAGTVSGATFGLGTAVQEFFIVAFGGIALGLVLGYVVSYIILKNVDDHLIETATTVALAFGSFVIAESFGDIIGVEGLHFSGILAVVAAGMLVGNIGFENTSPTTRITLDNFWEFLTFAVNSLVFLVIGLEIEVSQLQPNLVPILVAVAAILLSRVVIIYSIGWVHGRLRPKQKIPLPFPACDVLGRLARRDQSGAGAFAGRFCVWFRYRPGAARDDFRRGAVYAAGAGDEHRAADRAAQFVRQAAAAGGTAAAAGAAIRAASRFAGVEQLARSGIDLPRHLGIDAAGVR
jgi:CPA1 family monovalent cation:H+ antiporter